MVTISTVGDRITDRPLAEAGGKGLFTKELELALLAWEIDLAVHSMKDVPVTMPLVDQADLIIAAVPMREDARDVLVSRRGRSLAELPAGGTVATGSLRRKCQILQARPDLKILPLRGNIDTRLRKLESGESDAIVLALAGIKRIGRFDPSFMFPIETGELLPADAAVQAIVAVLHDETTARCVAAERLVVMKLEGDCHSPIAALATIDGAQLSLTAALGKSGGEPPVGRFSGSGSIDAWEQTVAAVCRKLLQS
jgi:hydroxymethylbilane synthase